MVAVLLLDIRSTINVHVLADVNRERTTRRRRNRRGSRASGSRREGDDALCLMQMPGPRQPPKRDGVQNGHIPEQAVADIVKDAFARHQDGNESECRLDSTTSTSNGGAQHWQQGPGSTQHGPCHILQHMQDDVKVKNAAAKTVQKKWKIIRS